ncbi:GAF domain-containing hybrid sensor histidine kinase/response regulator [Penaeicola halotolerans]|uniref:GAF domain-containing hybrid sensor histidine kinase/response regulator n=1 Tax=Penaeicola halotolerans TaxID=2793196 RepID=UPI001CF8C8F2|nr:GAF domain-containing hybrid sensor histidine kinase/response regulator [Penaeicola halotolerans]
MLVAPLPRNEHKRVAELRSYDILDTGPETAFDDIVKLASKACDTPIALISLVDDCRQWFKAKIGVPQAETTRDVSFCSHALVMTDLLEVPDTHQDIRFHDNPLVTGEPYIRFYAGYPLTTPRGVTLGTLCVMDTVPRKLDKDQIESLKILANQVITQLELRKSMTELRNTIKEKNKAEKNLKKALKENELASQNRRDLFAQVSHEIRTPLHGIMGLTSMLSETPLNKSQKELIDNLLASQSLVMSILNDILDYSKIEAGEVKVKMKPFPTQQAVGEVVKLFQPRAKEKNIYIRYQFEEDVPEYIVSDPQRLKQVLANLISNAVKFTTEGGVTVGVSLFEKNDKEALLKFYVNDTGMGISPEFQEIIFKKYKQAQDQSKFGGTGLGTAIAKKLTNLLGGHISVQSPIYESPAFGGPGSQFWLTIPVAISSESAFRKSQQTAELPKKPVTKKMHLLLAEDDELSQIFTKRLLEKEGYEVTLVTDGGKAWEAAQHHTFDAMLLDSNMPIINGIDLTAKLRTELKYERPIFSISAHIDEEHMLRCKKAGVSAFINKPFTKSDINEVLGKYLG